MSTSLNESGDCGGYFFGIATLSSTLRFALGSVDTSTPFGAWLSSSIVGQKAIVARMAARRRPLISDAYFRTLRTTRQVANWSMQIAAHTNAVRWFRSW